jgi:hypothetical protein
VEEIKPSNHWFHIPLQAIGIFYCVYFHFHLPSSGKALLILGGVVAIMMLMDMRPIHKSVYILIVLSFILIENRALNKDRTDASDAEKSQRDAENAQFQNIAGGITEAIKQSQKQFGVTMARSDAVIREEGKIAQKTNQSLQQLTGGGQYCYLSAYSVEDKYSLRSQPKLAGKIDLFVSNSGPIPLERCLVTIRNSTNREALDRTKGFISPLIFREVGPVPPAGTTTETGITLPRDTYYINILTRNDAFFEILTIHSESEMKTDGRFESIEIRDKKGKALANF